MNSNKNNEYLMNFSDESDVVESNNNGSFYGNILINELPEVNETVDIPTVDGINNTVCDYVQPTGSFPSDAFESNLNVMEMDLDFHSLAILTESNRSYRNNWHSSVKKDIPRSENMYEEIMGLPILATPNLTMSTRGEGISFDLTESLDTYSLESGKMKGCCTIV
ncbi:hypothetical protein BLOT_010981 [Blomia tropicalis]|nr:hypothetical protein BLOT_010981 [Blomia tropicalis]